ncbi:MAG: GspH/FimT family pseudopilin [Phycisphaerae bacterium]|nr:GspH/FimT family pseudopilin [Phycisphaerae bacterium]
MPTCRLRTAFTLVELLVALALLAVAAGIIVPRMSRSMGRSELREAAGRFAHTAKAARQYALARRQACAMEIDLDHGTYAVTELHGTGSGRTSQVTRTSWLKTGRWPGSIRVSAYQTPDGLMTMNGIQRLSFQPDGTTSGASIRFVHQADEYQVIVHPHSGQVVLGDATTTTFAEDQYDLGD